MRCARIAMMEQRGVGSACLTGMLALSVVVGGLAVVGCASVPSEPIPQQEIRGHADRFNEKMKQEEQERGSGPQGSSHGMMH